MPTLGKSPSTSTRQRVCCGNLWLSVMSFKFDQLFCGSGLILICPPIFKFSLWIKTSFFNKLSFCKNKITSYRSHINAWFICLYLGIPIAFHIPRCFEHIFSLKTWFWVHLSFPTNYCKQASKLPLVVYGLVPKFLCIRQVQMRWLQKAHIESAFMKWKQKLKCT